MEIVAFKIRIKIAKPNKFCRRITKELKHKEKELLKNYFADQHFIFNLFYFLQYCTLNRMKFII